jgi:hypothetical protein
LEDYLDEDADYVSVGGALITGRKGIQEFFERTSSQPVLSSWEGSSAYGSSGR